MTLIRYSGGVDPFQEMEQMMKQFWPMTSGQMPKAFVPAVDMYEADGAIVVELPLAGIDPSDVSVSVEKGVLTLQGESKHEHEMDDKNYYRKEVRSGSFFRQIALPVSVNEDAVTAVFTDGVLKVTAPKATPNIAKKIDVKVVKN